MSECYLAHCQVSEGIDQIGLRSSENYGRKCEDGSEENEVVHIGARHFNVPVEKKNSLLGDDVIYCFRIQFSKAN